jgi:hypothetical protein
MTTPTEPTEGKNAQDIRQLVMSVGGADPEKGPVTLYLDQLTVLLTKVAAPTPAPVAVGQRARTDVQIVEQTEELARLLMLEFYSREAPAHTLFRNADDPRGRHAWIVASRAQEMLTNTAVENSVCEVDDAPTPQRSTSARPAGSAGSSSGMERPG